MPPPPPPPPDDDDRPGRCSKGTRLTTRPSRRIARLVKLLRCTAASDMGADCPMHTEFSRIGMLSSTHLPARCSAALNGVADP